MIAGIPKGCIFNEATMEPQKARWMDLPSPHPGHHEIPSAANGHNEKLFSEGKNASINNAAAQNESSKYLVNIFLI